MSPYIGIRNSELKKFQISGPAFRLEIAKFKIILIPLIIEPGAFMLNDLAFWKSGFPRFSGWRSLSRRRRG